LSNPRRGGPRTGLQTLRDAGDPVELAVAYNSAGADELTFLDIRASDQNRNILVDLIEREGVQMGTRFIATTGHPQSH